MSRRVGVFAIGGVLALVMTGVIVASPFGNSTTPRPPEQPLVYVAVGASDSVGVGAADPSTEAWPVVFADEALPANTEVVNVAVPGAKVPQALAAQVPKAVAAEPDLVTVWLNVNDLRALVDPAVYGEQLRELVTALRRGGQTTVLVANTPELDQLPVVRSSPFPPALVEERVAEYNRVIAEVVEDAGAVLVDLHSPSKELEAAGRIPSLTSDDGFHPNAEGYREVARVFAATYRRVVDQATSGAAALRRG